MRSARRSFSGLLVLVALVASACGSRLSDEQLQVAIASNAGGGGAAAPGSGGVAGVGDSGTGAVSGGTDTTGDAGTGVSDAGAVDVGTGASSPGATGGDTTTGADPTSPGGSTTAGPDTRSAPAGGNGGATDIGVTEDKIVVFNVADISGAVPGIFQDAQLATQAYVAYFNATEGAIYGRRLELVVRDSQLNASQNRSHYQDACQQAFAAIGSMSAFDEGVAGPAGECGIPDIRAAVVNPTTMQVPNIFSSDAISDKLYPTNQFLFWRDHKPGCEGQHERAGMLYINNDTTTAQTRQVIAATQKIGYNWVVDEAIGLAETNYSSFVIKLKNEDVQFVFFQGDAPQAVRLAQAMRQQNYWPCTYGLQQNLYSRKLLAQGGDDIEGVDVAAGTVLLENIDQHPELQTYREWLKRISPDAEPTGQGMYAWGAAMLFTDLAKQIGPNLTRAAMVQALQGVSGFTGNGLFPPQDVGAKVPANCHIIVRVENGAFVAVDPPGGADFMCRGKAE